MADSGAQRTLLRVETARHLGLESTTTLPVDIVYGGGTTTIANSSVMLGNTQALVVPGLQENLISLNQLAEDGSSVYLQTDWGLVFNSTNKKTIPMIKGDRGWSIWLSDIMNYDLDQCVDPQEVSDTSNNNGASDTSDNHAELIRRLRANIWWKRIIGHVPENLVHQHSQSDDDSTTHLPSIVYNTGKRSRSTPIMNSEERRMWSNIKKDKVPWIRARAIRANARTIVEKYIELHERLGHCNVDSMCAAVSGANPVWSGSQLSAAQIRKASACHTCIPCLLAKRRRKSVPTNVKINESFQLDSSTAGIGNILSMDPVGIINPASADGYKYFFLVKDIKSGYLQVFCTKDKSAETVVEVLRQTLEFWKIWRHDVKVLRTDAEVVLDSDRVKSFLTANNVRHQSSSPYRHHENAIERDIQTVSRGTSTLLHSQVFLNSTQWDKALYHYVDCRNQQPNKGNMNECPSRVVMGVTVDLNRSFPFSFGDLVATTLEDHERGWKFDLKRDIGVYVGQAESKGAIQVMDIQNGGIKVRTDCIKVEVTDHQIADYVASRSKLSSSIGPGARIEAAEINFDVFPDTIYKSDNVIPMSIPLTDDSAVDDSEDAGDYPQEAEPMDGVRSSPPAVRRSFDPGISSDRVLRSASRSVRINEERDLSDFFQYRAFGAKCTVGQAIKSSDKEEWIKSIQDEVNQLITTGTLVPTSQLELEEKRIEIHSTMTLRKKIKLSGMLDKYKARLCACGNELSGEIAETYSPTIGALAYATVHQIAVIDGMEQCIVDTVGAYLYQDYPDDAVPLYLSLPSNVAMVCGMDPSVKYRVRKYLYGLPDAGRAYYAAYSSHLMANGYKRTACDPCLFTRIVGRDRTYVWTHVDDTFICSSSSSGIERFINVVQDKFKVTVNREVDEYLGIKMMEHLPNGDIKLTQPALLNSLLEEYKGVLAHHRFKGVISPQRVAIVHMDDDDQKMSQADYLHLVGALIYLTKSRPDIATAVSFGATYSAKPTKGAFREMIHCLKYLEETSTLGLIIRRGGKMGRPLVLTCYVDASYLTHDDSKSHMGFTMSFGTIGTFYSKSMKQQIVATSSTHSEMRALYVLIAEIIYVIHICNELDRPVSLPAIIMEDNSAVVALSEPTSSRVKKSKHFLMLIAYVREQVKEGIVTIRKVGTTENLADIFTKIVTGQPFRDIAAAILGISG